MFSFFFNVPATTEIYTLSLHDALPISRRRSGSSSRERAPSSRPARSPASRRSEEHTSELQSRGHLVCRLLLEKKKTKRTTHQTNKTYLSQIAVVDDIWKMPWATCDR